MGILSGDLRQIQGGADHVFNTLIGEIRRVGRTRMLSHEHSDARAARAGFGERLYFAHPNIDGKVVALGDGAFSGIRSALQREADYPLCKVLHAVARHAVPPTVMRSSLMVGIPTPTGTL